MTSLLEGNGKAWEKAQQELAEYMEAQSEDTAPTLKVGDKVTVAGQVGTIADFERRSAAVPTLSNYAGWGRIARRCSEAESPINLLV
ncbi:hypothetical protein [Scytonema sp. PCC 10023]|uniref:hypothetical protein n=1 Tax=Scytonema sp. PCC 10023 TaxID=1680591 RepID=UPI0039C5ACD2